MFGVFIIKIKIFRVGSLCLLLAWMGLIFYLSSQTAEISSGTSGRVIAFLLKYFYPSFRTLSEEAQAELTQNSQFLVRKGAHFFLYAMLGVFSFLSVVTYRSLKLGHRVLIAVAVCALYAALDEWHQTAVSGRSGELRDVLIDGVGAVMAILVFWLICVRFKSIDRRVKWNGTKKA